MAPEDGEVFVLTQHPAVQIAAEPARGPGVMAGVDEVRAHLEGLDRQTPPAQGIEQAQGDGGLAHPALGAGDDQAACLLGHSVILVAKSSFFPPHPNPLPPLGGEGIRGKNFWQTL